MNNMIQNNKYRKKICFYIIILSFLILNILTSSPYAALSAKTANIIQGTNPYIELNGNKITDLSRMLSIQIGADKYISDASGNMRKIEVGGSLTPVTIISMANADEPFDSVTTIVPADTTSYALNNVTITPLAARKDDDGDKDFVITGNLKGEWKDKNGTSIGNDLTGIPNICLAPYTLTLASTDSPSISTQYGVPRQTVYGNGIAKFIINPMSKPAICFAKPDMSYARGQFAGPDFMWDGGTTGGMGPGSISNGKGFKPQSNEASNYGNNFPTTGLNGLYFDLAIAGADTLTWPTVTVGNITATMSNATPTSVRVTLTGPKASSMSVGATAPAFTPTQIELEGKEGNITVVKYGFKLNKWYVNRGNTSDTVSNQAKWCKALNGNNYVLVSVKDLTNSSGGTWIGAMPSSPGNYYQRRIGAGLFAEWGNMYSYSGSGFVASEYWTSDTDSSSTNFVVYSSYFGYVATTGNYNNYGLCTQPDI